MSNCDLYDQTGAKKGTLELPDSLFGQEVNEGLMHRALVRQQANARQVIAHTKTRAEVVCSKRKIQRQKGSGRARHAQRSVNIFRGGGNAFGPRNDRNFAKDMPRAQRRKALFSALSVKAGDKKIIGITEYKSDKPSTKEITNLIKKLPIERSVLIVTPEKDENITLSVRNIPNAKVVSAGYVNVEDLLRYDNILVFEKAVDKMMEIFKPEKVKTKVTA